jgi:hypothetical protein
MDYFKYRSIFISILFGTIGFVVGSLIVKLYVFPEQPLYIKKSIIVVGSKDTIYGTFQYNGIYYLNQKDSSKIYIDKIVYEKIIK